MITLYFGRTSAYCHEVAELDAKQAEEVVDNQVKMFSLTLIKKNMKHGNKH
ncbi:MAG: hypothetical protein H8D23_23095 [Candidatus Brocadiales bacterium]|nr:hypothetical protein [Candidatus Brocadiales bacterium]